MPEFPPALPHGQLEEVFDDVFFVTGTTRPSFGGETWQFSRNMTVLREDGALTLVNAVRLSDAGLEELERLGEVKNVVKLGAFHGMDDAFYLERYRARLWALPGMEHERGANTDVELRPGGETPVTGCSVFRFETSAHPEGLLRLGRDGGVLVSCDSLQNWAEVDRFFSEESSAKMRELGFIRPANVGPGWLQFSEPQASDFERVEALSFRHLLPAHGTPLLDTAREELSATFRELFSRPPASR